MKVITFCGLIFLSIFAMIGCNNQDNVSIAKLSMPTGTWISENYKKDKEYFIFDKRYSGSSQYLFTDNILNGDTLVMDAKCRKYYDFVDFRSPIQSYKIKASEGKLQLVDLNKKNADIIKLKELKDSYKNDFDSIVFTSGSCEGTCPSVSIKLCPNGKLRYSGIVWKRLSWDNWKMDTIPDHFKTLSDDMFLLIQRHLSFINFKENNVSKARDYDVPNYTLTLWHNGKKSKIAYQDDNCSAEVEILTRILLVCDSYCLTGKSK